jgi:serine/threonine-protein kinase
VQSNSSQACDSSDPLLGQLLGDRYRVLRYLGQGGMGTVYLAEHVLIRRKVAIKLLHPAHANSVESVERFHREATAAAAIGNPHIVDVTDMGRLQSGAHYIVLEYLDGADLAWTIARQGRLPISEVLRIGLQLCDALDAVHAAGIVHRDLKPENLFLIERPGEPAFLKVLDFGICKFHDLGSRRITATGTAIGTPQFMAPEQLEGRSDVDARADLYAAGAILYFALSGRAPFEAETLPRLLAQICNERPARLRLQPSGLSSRLDRVIGRAMAKQRRDRYANARQLRAALLPLMAAALEARPARPARRASLARSGMRGTAPQPTHSPTAPAAALIPSEAEPRVLRGRLRVSGWLGLSVLAAIGGGSIGFGMLGSSPPHVAAPAKIVVPKPPAARVATASEPTRDEPAALGATFTTPPTPSSPRPARRPAPRLAPKSGAPPAELEAGAAAIAPATEVALQGSATVPPPPAAKSPVPEAASYRPSKRDLIHVFSDRPSRAE